jgi:hypothetical protein
MSTKKASSRRTPVSPAVAPTLPSADDIAVAADYIRSARAQLLIYSAALTTSKCELARSVGERLGSWHLSNDLDCARETLVGTERAVQS